MEKLNRIILDNADGKQYVIDCSGSGSGSQTPGPDSVGSEEVKDGSLGEQDMDDNVKAGLHELDNVGTIGTEAAHKMVADAIAEE